MCQGSGLMGLFFYCTLLAGDLQAFGLNQTIDSRIEHSEGKYASPLRSTQSKLTHPPDFEHRPIFYSEGLLVFDGEDGFYDFLPSAASAWTARASYRQFLLNKRNRKGQVFIGGNDGVLHAFDAQTGAETFAYSPKNQPAPAYQLNSSTNVYRPYIPSPLIEADIYDKRPTPFAREMGWRNIVVGTGGAAARSLFAIQVPVGLGTGTGTTNPSIAADILWEIDAHDAQFASLGYSLQKPGVGVMRDGTWVVMAGNGYTPSVGTAKLFIINALTGAHVKTIDVPTSGANGLGGVRLVLDLQRRISSAYAGDLLGNLWKFDFSNENPNHWGLAFGGRPLFRAQYALRSNAAATQAITATPAYLAHPRGGNLVVFGTGKWLQASDIEDLNMQTLYAVWDSAEVCESAQAQSVTAHTQTSGTSAMVSRASLVEQTVLPIQGTNFYSASKYPVNYADKRGWYINLNTMPLGLRLVQAPQLAAGRVLLQTISPGGKSTHDLAMPSASTVLFVLNPLTGSASAPTFDVNSDGVIDSFDALDSSGHAINAVAVTANKSAEMEFRQITGANGLSSALASDTRQTTLVSAKNALRRSWRQIIRRPSPASNTLDANP